MSGSGSLKDSEPIFRAVLESGGTFTLKPRGNSMRILLYKRQDGSFVLHRVAAVERDGTYTMCGDYQVILERGVRREDVVGVVTAIHRPQGDLVRGTKEFLAPARRRARNRPLRCVRYYGGRFFERLFRRSKQK